MDTEDVCALAFCPSAPPDVIDSAHGPLLSHKNDEYSDMTLHHLGSGIERASLNVANL